MHNPLNEYLATFWLMCVWFVTFGPIFHTNYYFSGRIIPKNDGTAQLCDDSW